MDEKKLLDILAELKDYEEASEALLELSHKNPSAAENYCKHVLKNQIGDIYYMGMVVDILYGLNRNFTLEFILENVDNLSEYVLSTALSNVIVDESLVPGSKELQEFISMMSKHINKNLPSNELEGIFLKFVSTFERKDIIINFGEVILSGKNLQINQWLSVESVFASLGEPEIYTPAHKSYPTMLVYGDLEFRFRHDNLEIVTITFGKSGAQIPIQIDIDQFKPEKNRRFAVIEKFLKQKQVTWKRDEIMSDSEWNQEVYITEHNVHLAFHKGILTKIGVVYI
jgi:hypothetical protein